MSGRGRSERDSLEAISHIEPRVSSSDVRSQSPESRGVSVAMCTYNGEAYLREQLESVIYQSQPPDEVVICDDRSTDATWSILESYWRQLPSLIKLHRNKTNLGPVKNFEKAISLCTREFIALCDQDDVWHYDKLQKLSQKLRVERDLALVFSNAERLDGDGKPLKDDLWRAVGFNKQLRQMIRHGDGLQALLKRSFVTGCTVMFRATLQDRSAPFSGASVHDYWIALMAAATSRIGFVDEKLVGYRQHGSNEIGARRLSMKQRIDKACRVDIERSILDKVILQDLMRRLSDTEGDRLSLVWQKIDFLEFRIALRSDEIPCGRKVALLGRRALRGCYGRWSRSWGTVAKDLAMVSGFVRASGRALDRGPS